MALDFHLPSDTARARPLFSVSHAQLEALAAALAQFERRAGLRLDPYGTTRLGPAQCGVLSELVEGGGAAELAQFLREAQLRGLTLLAEGD